MAPSPQTISSKCGAYSIQLGEPIQKPITKRSGAKVGVYNAKLLKSPEPVDVEAEAQKKAGHLGKFLAKDKQVRDSGLHFQENKGLAEPYDIVVKVFSSPDNAATKADMEILALSLLTKKKCQHTPTYFGNFRLGQDQYILMSKLPGASLDKSESWKFDKKSVRTAFDVAIKALHDCGIANRSTNLRNLIWEEIQGRCYIVDFERAVVSPDQRSGAAPAERERWVKNGWESFDHWTAH